MGWDLDNAGDAIDRAFGEGDRVPLRIGLCGQINLGPRYSGLILFRTSGRGFVLLFTFYAHCDHQAGPPTIFGHDLPFG